MIPEPGFQNPILYWVEGRVRSGYVSLHTLRRVTFAVEVPKKS